MPKASWDETNAAFMKLSKRGKAFAVLIMLAVGVGVVAILNPGAPPPPDPRPAPLADISKNKTAVEAYVGVQLLIEPQLKAPATAKWPSMQEVKSIYNESSDQWTIVAYVDSQNAFGALIRTQFIAVLDYLGESRWNMAEFTITN